LPSIAPSDLFLSPTLTEDEAREYLRSLGFADPAAADQHLQAMADELPVREALGGLAATLLDAVSRCPDPDAAIVAFTRYTATRLPRAAFLRYLGDDPRALGVLVEVMGSSPFLSEILIRNPEYFHWLVSQVERAPPEQADLADEADLLLGQVETESGRADALRRFKRREILRIASRDILGRETLQSATEQLSDLADVVTERGLRLVERTLLSDRGLDRLPGSFAVIGMGKLGGRELNYSSDIDLVFVYETEDEEDDDAHRLFHKLGRALVKMLTDFTDESYLYRVDLRLRPMGRRGNVAYSLRQHAQYYDTWGETFERFALLKARPIAGDLGLGRRFVEMVEPFVYRRYLDHAALEEIFRHKLRAEQQQPDSERDVKVGRGGIREIEVFAQALQLTYGATNPDLRRTSTLDALDALARASLIGGNARDALRDAYVFLRTLEHRLQIVEEQQTHTLSRADRELAVCARRLGLPDAAALEAELERNRVRVRETFEALFERRPGAREFRSRQWFRVLGDEATSDETAALVAGLGLDDGEEALAVIRALDQATALAPSRSMARNVLSNLLPPLLDRVARCARPGQVLIRLEQLTERTGAASSFYRTLLENEGLRDLLIAALDQGDLMASGLVQHPELLDSLADRLPAQKRIRAHYRALLEGVAAGERAAGIRRFKAVEELKTLADWVARGGPEETEGHAALDELHRRLSLVAESAVGAAARWAWSPGGRTRRGARQPEWTILALGKLGGQELTVHSDLDLVVVYDGDPADSATFMAHQELVAAFERLLEEPTADGVAYQVDTRLRPEGRKGALAMPFVAFERYFLERAEIWERLAWTRCRSIAGAPGLGARVVDAAHRFVYAGWDDRIPAAMADIRRRMERELAQPGGPHLELKVGRGGLADIDFALQMIQIREGAAREELRVPGTRELLSRLAGTVYLDRAERAELGGAYAFLRRLELFARMDVDGNLNAVPVEPERLEVLGKRMGLAAPAGESLVSAYERITARVRVLYDAVLERL
jgi:glutamate-ammonia-ligase adenylyltransferase